MAKFNPNVGGRVESQVGIGINTKYKLGREVYHLHYRTSLQRDDYIIVNELIYDKDRKGRHGIQKRFIARIQYIFNNLNWGDPRTGRTLVIHMICNNAPCDKIEYNTYHNTFENTLSADCFFNGAWAVKKLPEGYKLKKKYTYDELDIMNFLSEGEYTRV